MAAEVSLRCPDPAASGTEEVDAAFRRVPPVGGVDLTCCCPLLLLLVFGLGCRCPCVCVAGRVGRLCCCLRFPSAGLGVGLDGVRVAADDNEEEGAGAAEELPAPPAAASSRACRLNSLVEDATVPDPDSSDRDLDWASAVDFVSGPGPGLDRELEFGLGFDPAAAAAAGFFPLPRALCRSHHCRSSSGQTSEEEACSSLRLRRTDDRRSAALGPRLEEDAAQ